METAHNEQKILSGYEINVCHNKIYHFLQEHACLYHESWNPKQQRIKGYLGTWKCGSLPSIHL